MKYVKVRIDLAALFDANTALIIGIMAQKNNEWTSLSELEEYLNRPYQSFIKNINSLLVGKPLGCFVKGKTLKNEHVINVYKLSDSMFNYMQNKGAKNE